MPPLILLGLIAGLPLILTTLLRVRPIYVFVSIVSGYFGATLMGDSLQLMLGSIIHVQHIEVISKLALLLLPFILSLLLLRKTLPTASLPFQFILLVADSLLLATFIVPVLTPGVQGALYAANIGNIFRQSYDVLIVAVASMQMLAIWITRPGRQDTHGKHKKH